MMKKIAVLPGDGIGKEVTEEAVKVLKKVVENSQEEFEIEQAPVGGTAYDLTGTPLPEATLNLAKESDAVLLGAVGGLKWESLDYSVRPERALLGLRKELNLYCNLRPAKVFPALASASSLKEEIISGTDIMVVRELVGGIYFGEPKGVDTLPDGTQKGYNTLVYTTPEIERIAHSAFQTARLRDKRVVSVDKANVLECTELWRNVVIKVHKEHYSDIELSHMYVDNAAMQLVRSPKQFDVIVTTNMFGDILSDIASMLTGSIGMLPSASLCGTKGMYEPVHGSAPDIAGQNKANPIATILSVAMMLKYSFAMEKEAEAIEKAVEGVLNDGLRTIDIASGSSQETLGTVEMGEEILKRL
ncbi:MAG: 3-isopropylmalate dehydrogenase [Nitrospinae bacterium]|nr:3-isopropylmalate dehydrogenase [Nitrospinota bacterium]